MNLRSIENEKNIPVDAEKEFSEKEVKSFSVLQIEQTSSLKNIPTYEEINRPFKKNAMDFINYFESYGYHYIPNPGDSFAIYTLKKFESQLYQLSEKADINTHWKIHLSCHPDHLEKMWELVVPLLLENQCAVFKCSKRYQEKISISKRTLDNMQITIYVAPGDEERHNAIIEKIEQILSDNKIKASDHISNSDRQIGCYSSVRFCGYGKPLSYINALKAKLLAKVHGLPRYNLACVPDPFKKLVTSEQNFLNEKMNLNGKRTLSHFFIRLRDHLSPPPTPKATTSVELSNSPAPSLPQSPTLFRDSPKLTNSSRAAGSPKATDSSRSTGIAELPVPSKNLSQLFTSPLPEHVGKKQKNYMSPTAPQLK